MLFDTHTHVNFNAFKKDGKEVIARALDKSVWMVNVGSQITTSERAVTIAREYPEGVWAGVGLHPLHLYEQYVDELEIPFQSRKEEFCEDAYRKLAKDPKVVAIGEIGLDYFRFPKGEDPVYVKRKQKEVFEQQLALAESLQKPVLVHCRPSREKPLDGYRDILKILDHFPRLYGISHCFLGDIKTAEALIERGFMISFSGIVTFRNASDLQKVVQEMPLDRIVIETDAPYLTPEPYRGRRNEPSYIRFTAQKIAELKSISLEEAMAATTENAKRILNFIEEPSLTKD